MKKKNSLQIKLIEPEDDTSPIYKFSKRGGGLHHICFKCSDVHKEIIRLKDMGLKLITQPEPGEAFKNNCIAFLFAKQGLNIELIDTDERADLLP